MPRKFNYIQTNRLNLAESTDKIRTDPKKMLIQTAHTREIQPSLMFQLMFHTIFTNNNHI